MFKLIFNIKQILCFHLSQYRWSMYVINELNNLKCNKSVRLDKITARLLKDSCEIVAPVLMKLINLYL